MSGRGRRYVGTRRNHQAGNVGYRGGEEAPDHGRRKDGGTAAGDFKAALRTRRSPEFVAGRSLRDDPQGEENHRQPPGIGRCFQAGLVAQDELVLPGFQREG